MIAHRKTKCLMLVKFLNLLLNQRSARKHLPTDQRTINELKPSTIKSVPKKKKIVQDKNETPPEAAGAFKVKAGKGTRARRSIASRKPRDTSVSKSATVAKGAIPLEARGIAEPSDEAVRLRAYFISERRRRFALPGDAESDWLEAKRQLLSESGRR
jgi:hypothetical protein